MRTRDIERFKKVLLEQKEQICKNIKDAAQEMDLLRQDGVADELDQASMSAEAMIDSSISLQQNEELKNIERALAKIENQTFGICEMCAEEIPMQRLKVKPHAKFCIDCREIYEKEKKQNKSWNAYSGSRFVPFGCLILLPAHPKGKKKPLFLPMKCLSTRSKANP